MLKKSILASLIVTLLIPISSQALDLDTLPSQKCYSLTEQHEIANKFKELNECQLNLADAQLTLNSMEPAKVDHSTLIFVGITAFAFGFLMASLGGK